MSWSSIRRVLLDALLIIVVTFVLTIGSGIYNVALPTHPAPSPLTPLDASLDYRNVSFNAPDDVRIAGWFVPSVQESSNDAILVLPSYTADKGSIFPHIAFLAQKFNVLAIDFRHTGQSGGSYAGAGVLETKDALAAVDFLKKQGMEKVCVYGFGLGGSVALTLAKISPDVICAVSEGAYADLTKVVQEPYKPFGIFSQPLAQLTIETVKITSHIDLEAVSPAHVLPGTQAHILVIHADQDPIVPFSEAQTIQGILATDPNFEFWSPHSSVHGEGTQEFAQRLDAFFAEHFHP